jgi:hypothetical protein
MVVSATLTHMVSNVKGQKNMEVVIKVYILLSIFFYCCTVHFDNT